MNQTIEESVSEDVSKYLESIKSLLVGFGSRYNDFINSYNAKLGNAKEITDELKRQALIEALGNLVANLRMTKFKLDIYNKNNMNVDPNIIKEMEEFVSLGKNPELIEILNSLGIALP